MQLSFCHPEFEEEVRRCLNVYGRPITDEDALSVVDLDLLEFSFKEEDVETLFHFTNLKTLSISFSTQDYHFWSHFINMEDLFYDCLGPEVDFGMFEGMENLKYLSVSGGDWSDISFKSLDALTNLSKLEELTLHEFGRVDLAPLSKLTQIKYFGLQFADKAENINTIGEMTWLEELNLCGLYVENLDFLDTLPDTVCLDICGIEIYGCSDINVEKWKRFKKRDINEIMIKDKYWNYIDLSPLDN